TAPQTSSIYTLSLHDALPILFRDEGRLKAVGEPGKHIWFYGTNDEKGFWRGLAFQNTGSGEHVLDYVQIKGAGSKEKGAVYVQRSEEHTSELQSRENLVCRLL